MEQLDFFETSDAEKLTDRIVSLERKIENMRRGLFSRYSECEKAITFLESEMEVLSQELLALANHDRLRVR